MSKPLSYKEIRERAYAFAAEWRGETNERAEAQTFWNEWFTIFGIRRRRVAQFEQHATRSSTGGRGRVDAFWPGQVAVEHKSAGRSLEEAEQQALDYLGSFTENEQPRLVITSDFARFRVLDLEGDGNRIEFILDELPDHLELFAFLAGYESRTFAPADAVNVAAAEMMGALHDALADIGYGGHDLRVFLVRMVFLLFADDTGVWEKGLLDDFIANRTAEDGSDFGPMIERLFQLLDTPGDRRSRNLDELLAGFPYINGRLFEERIAIPDFDRELREMLIECAAFDWTAISPAIFGSMFQAVMEADARRAIGAHYTTEQNIMKVIGPLFLDQLRGEFESARNSKRRLRALHDRLATLTVFDPAAGCGNFLLIAYQQLRRLEHDILVRLADLDGTGQRHLDIDQISGLSKVDVDQFYAVELEEFPARIAETALYLVDHLENMRLSKAFGQYFARIPLKAAAAVHVGNALDMDWEQVLPAADCTYLLGNPPFVGMPWMTDEQHAHNRRVFTELEERTGVSGRRRTGRLDYVACWYAKALTYLQNGNPKVAFVSTNSLTVGEQARTMGPLFAELDVGIDFAHRTFKWTSEARGAAVVHVVVIGFSKSRNGKGKARLFEYPDIAADPVERVVDRINFYLADAPDVYPAKRYEPLLAGLPKATQGNKPWDGGHLIISPDEYTQVAADPIASKYLRPYRQTREFLYGLDRWCLWLVNAPPQDLRNSPELKRRLAAVRNARSSSPTPSVRDQASTPALFSQIRQPTNDYFAVPEVSSKDRGYVPGAILPADTIAGNKLIIFPGAPKWVVAILQSAMWTAWVKAICGRLKSDPSISPGLGYYTFPFVTPSRPQQTRLEDGIEAVFAARAAHPDATLAELYDPTAMPRTLHDAHLRLDRAVDLLYGKRRRPAEGERLAVLLDRHVEMTDPLGVS